MSRMRRRATALGAGLVLGASLLGAPSTPAVAAPAEGDTLVFLPYAEGVDAALVHDGQTTTVPSIQVRDAALVGDFSGEPGSDVFVYASGSARDEILHVPPNGGDVGARRPEVVNGYYNPQVGDFDGNGIDDILWYGEGKARPDSIWLFQPNGTHTTVTLSVTGYYVPVVGDFDGNGHDDVIWQGYTGDQADSMWMFGEGATYTRRNLTITGRYQALVGRFVPADTEADQVAWYSSSGGPSSIWTFTPYGKTSRPFPALAQTVPVVGDFRGTGRDAVYWYSAGSLPEAITSFDAAGVATLAASVPVNGSYDPVVGDWDGDLQDDIAWTAAGKAYIWRFTNPEATAYTQTVVDTGLRQTVPVAAPPTLYAD